MFFVFQKRFFLIAQSVLVFWQHLALINYVGFTKKDKCLRAVYGKSQMSLLVV